MEFGRLNGVVQLFHMDGRAAPVGTNPEAAFVERKIRPATECIKSVL
jgi:hypothetical protein